MKTFKIGKKKAVAIRQNEFVSQCGFEVADYVTLTLAIKRLYERFDMVIAEFDDELFACEGLIIDPLGLNVGDEVFSNVDDDISLREYCAQKLNLEYDI